MELRVGLNIVVKKKSLPVPETEPVVQSVVSHLND